MLLIASLFFVARVCDRVKDEMILLPHFLPHMSMYSLPYFYLSAKTMYLKGPSLICCCRPQVNLISSLKVLDTAALVKSCFPKPSLALTVDRRVSVDVGLYPDVCEIEVERRVEGNVRKGEKAK